MGCSSLYKNSQWEILAHPLELTTYTEGKGLQCATCAGGWSASGLCGFVYIVPLKLGLLTLPSFVSFVV